MSYIASTTENCIGIGIENEVLVDGILYVLMNIHIVYRGRLDNTFCARLFMFFAHPFFSFDIFVSSMLQNTTMLLHSIM